jgi:hypothetical protein
LEGRLGVAGCTETLVAGMVNEGIWRDPRVLPEQCEALFR